jgi:hypothetical protein
MDLALSAQAPREARLGLPEESHKPLRPDINYTTAYCVPMTTLIELTVIMSFGSRGNMPAASNPTELT